MLRLLILWGLVLVLPGASAWAGTVNWRPMAIADDHSSWLFMDPASIVRKQKKVSVRALLEYSQPMPGMVETNSQPYVMVRTLMSFNCAAKTLLPLEEEYLDGDEMLVGQIDVSSATWDPVLAESLIEPVFDVVCGKEKIMGSQSAPVK